MFPEPKKNENNAKMGRSMNKTIRIVLYVLSILTVAGVIAAAILTGGQTQPVITSGTAVTEEKQSDTADKTDENGTAPDGADNTPVLRPSSYSLPAAPHRFW